MKIERSGNLYFFTLQFQYTKVDVIFEKTYSLSGIRARYSGIIRATGEEHFTFPFHTIKQDNPHDLQPELVIKKLQEYSSDPEIPLLTIQTLHSRFQNQVNHFMGNLSPCDELEQLEVLL